MEYETLSNKNLFKNKWVIIGIILFLILIGYKIFMAQFAAYMQKMQASMPSAVEVTEIKTHEIKNIFLQSTILVYSP